MTVSKGDRIKQLRLDRELTQEDVGKIIGASKQTLHKYETGIITNIPQDKIEALANLFDVSPAFIMGWEQNNQGDKPKLMKLNKMNKIPILGQIVCGDPILSYENLDGYYTTDPDVIDADFILYADGDSMIDAGINDGDLVFFRQTPQVENGAIAAVLIDGQTTLKKFYKQKDSIILQPENPDYEPIIITGERLAQTKILGEMVGVYSKRNK